MISIVAAFTVHLYIANRRQTRGRVTLEGVVSWQTLPSVPLKNSIKILSRSGLTWLLTYESHLQPGFRYTY